MPEDKSQVCEICVTPEDCLSGRLPCELIKEPPLMDPIPDFIKTATAIAKSTDTNYSKLDVMLIRDQLRAAWSTGYTTGLDRAQKILNREE